MKEARVWDLRGVEKSSVSCTWCCWSSRHKVPVWGLSPPGTGIVVPDCLPQWYRMFLSLSQPLHGQTDRTELSGQTLGPIFAMLNAFNYFFSELLRKSEVFQ